VPVMTEDQARELIEREYPDAQYGEWEMTWCSARLLVWADAMAAAGDDGGDAVAEILGDEDGGAR